MSYIETGTFTSDADFYSKLATFIQANGHTVDVLTSTRLHAHKGDIHIELWGSGGLFYMMGCAGYDSGAASAAQPGGPGAGIYNAIHYTSPSYYRFISTPNAIYVFVVGHYTYSYKKCLLAWGTVVDKVGGWTGGLFFSATGIQYVGSGSGDGQNPASSGAYDHAQLYCNGSWTPLAAAGGMCGQIDVAATFYQKMPFKYNAGLLPVPANLFVRDTGASALLHPVGRLSDIMLFEGGSVYMDLDTITIGGEDWVCSNGDPMNPGTGSIRYLFRVGA